MTKYIFILIIFLLFVWRIRRGWTNGIMKEIVTIISGAVSLVCVVLVFFAITSVLAKAMSTLTLCVVGLIVLGIAFRLCSLIFTPILALSNISVIGWLDTMLGAVMGAAEACVIASLAYYVLGRMGISVL